MGLNRASLEELYEAQPQMKETPSDIRHLLNKWTPRIDDVRAQQVRKLKEVLRKFERAAKDGADEVITLWVAPLNLVSAFWSSLGALLT